MDEIKPLTHLERLLTWVFNVRDWGSWEGWAARIIFLLVTACFLLWLLRYVVEFFAKLVEAWQKLGLQIGTSAEERTAVRRRIQFCKVLESDLATLAKAENWNDQWFTDLEAEVEVEGKYYARTWDRLIRKSTKGLRRIPSLTKAIESSGEQFLLVVGEPGSGKSVALRHMAMEFAWRATKSKSRKVLIPLYVNLKELTAAPSGEPNADFIKNFVLDNVRRGDADTAAYVREHWDEYRDKGNWFFLFDSFDEIPAVMHAPTKSRAIDSHANAIRQFLQGMTVCRGVIASREFKGPRILPWHKLRILPLTAARQELLVENSFLPGALKVVVRGHLAESESKLLNNPLFLTLLCRYVRDEKKLPSSDHDLVAKHIVRLAHRDSSYTSRHYQLKPQELQDGAQQLAVLFAEDKELSLSPTRDEISAANQRAGGLIQDIDNLLSALVDVKIARCDVKESREGDRRFTFSHRRFQEVLYVQCLANNPQRLSTDELLTNQRWREYSVTFLQTQATDLIAPLLVNAERMLAVAVEQDPGERILQSYGGHLVYFDWKNDASAHILRILQEGLMPRRQDIPKTLIVTITKLLVSRWERGDAFDRTMVIQLGGLFEADQLLRLLTWAIEKGPSDMKDAAFRACQFLDEVPDDLAKWLRIKLSNNLVTAGQKTEFVRISAWASRLPASVGASQRRRHRTAQSVFHHFAVLAGAKQNAD